MSLEPAFNAIYFASRNLGFAGKTLLILIHSNIFIAILKFEIYKDYNEPLYCVFNMVQEKIPIIVMKFCKTLLNHEVVFFIFDPKVSEFCPVSKNVGIIFQFEQLCSHVVTRGQCLSAVHRERKLTGLINVRRFPLVVWVKPDEAEYHDNNSI